MIRFTPLYLLIITGFLLTSCVTKKKYEETLLNSSKRSQYFEDQIDLLGRQIANKEAKIDSLEILYAEQRGANEVLLITQDKLQDRLDEVQDKVLQEQASKNSTTQDFSMMVKEKEALIQQRNQKLSNLQQIIDKQAGEQNKMMADFTNQLTAYGTDKYSAKIISGELRLSLSEDLFFRSGQARVKTEGIGNLARMAGLINTYPSIKVYVIGNTDNQKPRSFKDNWELSALRAVNVVRVLTDEYGVSPSRIIAGGKGEFAPIASNSSPQGQAENRRMDFIVISRMDRVVRDIDKALKAEE